MRVRVLWSRKSFDCISLACYSQIITDFPAALRNTAKRCTYLRLISPLGNILQDEAVSQPRNWMLMQFMGFVEILTVLPELLGLCVCECIFSSLQFRLPYRCPPPGKLQSLPPPYGFHLTVFCRWGRTVHTLQEWTLSLGLIPLRAIRIVGCIVIFSFDC